MRCLATHTRGMTTRLFSKGLLRLMSKAASRDNYPLAMRSTPPLESLTLFGSWVMLPFA